MVVQLEDAGLAFVGKDDSGRRMEVDIRIMKMALVAFESMTIYVIVCHC